MTSSGQKTSPAQLELSATQFEQVRQIVYQKCGINLTPGKEELVKSRLVKRLSAVGLHSFDAYLQFVKQDLSGKELTQMLDVLTTNKTYFYRESAHFDYLCQEIVPQMRQRTLRIWSAGCSSGEEPYTIAMLLREHLKGIDTYDVRILATDLSTRVLEKAQAAVYSPDTLSELPPTPIGVKTLPKLGGRGLPSQSFKAGLGSQMSIWLGPPSMNKKTTLFAFGAKWGDRGLSGLSGSISGWSARAASARSPERAREPKPRPARRKNSRRLEVQST